MDNNYTNYSNVNSKKIFTIECEDIILREFLMEDLDAIYNITLQKEIGDFLPDWVISKEKRREYFSKYQLKENAEFLASVPNIKDNILRLAIILKETNEIIGWIITALKDELPAPNREIGYAVSNEYTCRGYASQAAKGLIKYLFENTDLDVLNAIALTYNTPSNKVIQKSGFKLVGNIEIEGKDFYYYKLSKSEWLDS